MALILLRTATAGALVALSWPALATPPIPAPEIGIGIGSMVLIGATYTYLRRRLDGRNAR